MTLDLSVGVEIIEDIIGEVDRHACGVFVYNWADEQGGSIKILVFETEGGGVGGVDVEHWVDEGCAVGSLVVEGCVDVIEETVSDINYLPRRCCNTLPLVKFLRNVWWIRIMIPVKGRESTQSSPSCTKLLCSIICITADI